MKKFLKQNPAIVLCVLLVLCLSSVAQVPQRMGYQAVVRHANNRLAAEELVGVRLSILDTTGTTLYCETHQTTTNTNGLFCLMMGDGTAVTGAMSGIDWSLGHYTFRCEVAFEGDTAYGIVSESEIVTVPYAFLSERAIEVVGLSDSLSALRSMAIQMGETSLRNDNMLRAKHSSDSAFFRSLLSEEILSMNVRIHNIDSVFEQRFNQVSLERVADIERLMLALNTMDSVSADSLNRKIATIASSVDTMKVNIQKDMDALAVAFRFEDSAAFDSMNAKIVSSVESINLDFSDLRFRLDSLASSLSSEETLLAIRSISDRIDLLSSSLDTAKANLRAQISRLDTSSRSDEVVFSDDALRSRVDSLIAAIDTAKSNLRASITAVLSMSRIENEVSADSLDRKLRFVLAAMDTLRANVNLSMESLAAALRSEDSASADSLNAKIVMAVTMAESVKSNVSTTLASLASDLRAETAASADSLNAKIISSATVSIDTVKTNLRTGIAALASALRSEDAASADSLNAKIISSATISIDTVKTNLRAGIAALASALRSEDAASADSLNAKITEVTISVDTVKANLRAAMSGQQGELQDTIRDIARTFSDTAKYLLKDKATLQFVLAKGADAGNVVISNLNQGSELTDAANLQNIKNAADTLVSSRHLRDTLDGKLNNNALDSIITFRKLTDSLDARLAGSQTSLSKQYVDSVIESKMVVTLRKLNRVLITSGMGEEVDGYDDGTLVGIFSISETKKVKFSKGNLQYQASTDTWRFAEYQYDRIGTRAGNSTPAENRASSADWIDMFGYGTSGWNSGVEAYHPYSVSTTASDYYAQSLFGVTANADWGVYNAISNGGDNVGLWRTLTKDEWEYLLHGRPGVTINSVENNHYLMAQVMGINGLIVFPDDFVWPSEVTKPTITSADAAGDNYSNHQYNSSANWTALENAGCVFLPSCDVRTGVSVANQWLNGYYWTSSFAGGNQAYAIRIRAAKVEAEAKDVHLGHSVRLVQIQ
ncbi:MAG: hypothetical protein IJ764_03565 [Bacteroidales bacterium]|nr:hypothetical protein [Bacteroidales bacterium]